MKQRGIFEKRPDSGIWYIRYVDAVGRLRREKAGSKSAAILLYRKRKQQALEGRKLPEKLRQTVRPTLKEFAVRFMQAVRVRCAAKPRTIEFYSQQTRYLLTFEPLASRCLDAIDEALIEEFCQVRRQQVSIPTTNRALAVLRRMLRLAYEWRIVDRVPRMRLLPGERNRDFVLSREQERIYLEFSPEILRDTATLMLDSGLGPAETLALEWRDIHLDEPGSGYLQVREGKTRYRPRSVNLTSRVRSVLEKRAEKSNFTFVFAGETGRPYLPSSLAHLHAEIRRKLKLPQEFVLYSLRHTALTRLGQAGADAFTIMRIAGHSSITTSQRYVHPSSETLGLAIARLDSANQRAVAEVNQGRTGTRGTANGTDTRIDTCQQSPSVNH
jgi:integrase